MYFAVVLATTVPLALAHLTCCHVQVSHGTMQLACAPVKQQCNHLVAFQYKIHCFLGLAGIARCMLCLAAGNGSYETKFSPSLS